MKIDIEKIEEIVKKGDEIFLSAEGEKALIDLLKIEEQLEKAKTAIREKLEVKALSLDKNFKKIQGEKIKVYYRTFGSKYYIDESYLDDIPEDLYRVHKRIVADTKNIEDYSKQNGSLPIGVKTADRKKSISISYKNESEGEND